MKSKLGYIIKNFGCFKSIFKDQKKKIFVIGHKDPDGDSIGSQVAITKFLNNIGYDSYAIFNKNFKLKKFDFIYKKIPFLHKDNLKKINCKIITVDCANLERIEKDILKFIKDQKVNLNIDHHISNSLYGEFNYINHQSTSTCEILFDFISSFNDKKFFDPLIAKAIYTGIVTDTNQFSNGCINSSLFKKIAYLLSFKGVNPCSIIYKTVLCYPIEKKIFLIEFLQSLSLKLSGRVCIGKISYDFFKKNKKIYNFKGNELIEGLTNYSKNIKGVSIGIALFQLKKNLIKCSLRSKSYKYKIDKLAEKFGGGGHFFASGFQIKNERLNTAQSIIIKEVSKLFLL
jgi:phosphoesterase RecJ-like protein